MPGCTIQAAAVDHIVPPEDGGAVFDPENLRAICTHCNNVRAMRTRMQEGWRRSATWIVLVMGPPASGKSTYIAEHKGPHDLVIDYGAMAESMGGASHKEVMAARNAVLKRVQRGQVEAPRVWIHSANPEAERMFPYHEVVSLDPGRDEVLSRCSQDRVLARLAEDWYRKRTPVTRREW